MAEVRFSGLSNEEVGTKVDQRLWNGQVLVLPLSF
jgi:hypothetical protein